MSRLAGSLLAIAVLVIALVLGLSLGSALGEPNETNVVRMCVRTHSGDDLFCALTPAGLGFREGHAMFTQQDHGLNVGVHESAPLAPGQHLFLLRGLFGRTALRITVPRPKGLIDWRPYLLPARPTQITDSLVRKETVEHDENGDEILVFHVCNQGESDVRLHPEEIRLLVFKYEMMAYSPRIIQGNQSASPVMGEPQTVWDIPAGGSTEIHVNWPNCVRNAVWAWGDTNGPQGPTGQKGQVGVRPVIGRSGGLGVSLRDPMAILAEDSRSGSSGRSH